MRLFSKKCAEKIFYYLMIVDEEISPDELECFDSIGNELDPEHYQDYRESIMSECENHLHTLIDPEDYYEVVLEGVDTALNDGGDDGDNCISFRFLIWNMLALAFSNQNYSSCERRLIKHIVRTMGIEKSVFLEMEQLMETNNAIEQELHWVENSSRPYAEVRPIVDELNNRRNVIVSCGKALIEDEFYASVEKISYATRKKPIIAKKKTVEPDSTDSSKAGHKAALFFAKGKEKKAESDGSAGIDTDKQPRKFFGVRKSKEAPKTDAPEPAASEEDSNKEV